MGSCLWSSSPIAKFLLLGTVNAGKTSLLRKFPNGKYVYSPIDQSEYFFGCKEEIFSVDVKKNTSGMLMRKYYPSANGIVLMIDSGSRKRLEENLMEIEGYLGMDDYIDLPIVVMNNIKGGAIEVTPGDIVTMFNFERQKRRVKVFNCNCLSLENVNDAMEWLRENSIKTNKFK